jgi:uncharacterized integral membrane protein (TIGR00698 family)
MSFSRENRPHTLNGILFVALFATSATYIADISWLRHLGISPLIVGIVLGMVYANTLRGHLPKTWNPGIVFSTKTLLRAAIVFYGFRLTFQSIAQVGVAGVLVSMSVVTFTFILGYLVGTRLLGLDRDTVILVSAGSSICGAAAVLATEPVIEAEPHKSAIAVSTVVLFGSIAMFLYPYLYRAGFLDLSAQGMGIYIGGTIHEVAHVVAAGNAISDEVARNAVIVKMLRVMMIAPFLIVLGLWLQSKARHLGGEYRGKRSITIPWFAVWFIAVAGFNSLNLLSASVVDTINHVDTFALTMAMTALGMETSIDKFKGVGMKPVYLASVLFVWLIFGGYALTKLAINLVPAS